MFLLHLSKVAKRKGLYLESFLMHLFGRDVLFVGSVVKQKSSESHIGLKFKGEYCRSFYSFIDKGKI